MQVGYCRGRGEDGVVAGLSDDDLLGGGLGRRCEAGRRENLDGCDGGWSGWLENCRWRRELKCTFELCQGPEYMACGYVPDIHVTFLVSCDEVVPLIHDAHGVYRAFVVSCKPLVCWQRYRNVSELLGK